jgi:hypothetical protein
VVIIEINIFYCKRYYCRLLISVLGYLSFEAALDVLRWRYWMFLPSSNFQCIASSYWVLFVNWTRFLSE